MNTVEIDAAALEAEAQAAVNSSPPTTGVEAPPAGEGGDALPAGSASPEQIVEGYKVIALAVIDRGSAVLTPAWTWRPEKKAGLASAIAQASFLWFGEMPIPPKYLALLIVANALVEIVDDNRDAQGNLKPFRAVPPKPAASSAAASPAN